MRRVATVRSAGAWDADAAREEVVLDFDQRYRRRMVMTTEAGSALLLDRADAEPLRDGDGLILEDGSCIRVTARPEPLIEISAANPRELARLAWHLGNRHVDVQIAGHALRIRRDHVLEDMLVKLGATIVPIEQPFDPERGAYDASGHRSHHHRHHDGDGPAHGHHAHLHRQGGDDDR